MKLEQHLVAVGLTAALLVPAAPALAAGGQSGGISLQTIPCVQGASCGSSTPTTIPAVQWDPEYLGDGGNGAQQVDVSNLPPLQVVPDDPSLDPTFPPLQVVPDDPSLDPTFPPLQVVPNDPDPSPPIQVVPGPGDPTTPPQADDPAQAGSNEGNEGSGDVTTSTSTSTAPAMKAAGETANAGATDGTNTVAEVATTAGAATSARHGRQVLLGATIALTILAAALGIAALRRRREHA